MADWHDLRAKFRPIDVWPEKATPSHARRRAPFKAPWRGTIQLLERELRMLRAKNVIIQIDVPEAHLRLDGYPRADARPRSPGVILAFDSKYGPLRYPCDTFVTWQENLRAIALALEALRKVDRYGVTRRAEQYTGWRALPAQGAATMTATAAAEYVALHGAHANGGSVTVRTVLESREVMESAWRAASKKLHPDVGGSHEAMSRLTTAKRVLDQHHSAGTR